MERQHSVRGFVETESSPFGLSFGRDKNSLLTEYSSFLTLQFLPLIADSRFLPLRTIGICATASAPADFDLGFETKIIIYVSTTPYSSHPLQTLSWRLTDTAYTISG